MTPDPPPPPPIRLYSRNICYPWTLSSALRRPARDKRSFRFGARIRLHQLLPVVCNRLDLCKDHVNVSRRPHLSRSCAVNDVFVIVLQSFSRYTCR